MVTTYPAGRQSDLRRLFDPRTIAVVGASEDPGRNVARSMQATMWAGFTGRLLPVNPKYRSVFGHPCVPSIADIREPIDIVMAFVGPDRLLDVYRSCRGAGFFIAVGDLVPKGAADADRLAAELLGMAKDGWPRIVGQQCVGIVSPHTGAAATISTAVDETGLPRGPIGIISQSGGIVSSLIERARRIGGGFSHLVSSGGEFDLTTLDYLRFMIDDDATRVIGIYAESVADYAGFLALGRQARARGKAVLLLQPGRSAAGAAAAQSHSGRIVGDRQVKDAAYRRNGIVVVDDVDDLLVGGMLLADHGLKPDRGVKPGSGIGVVSLSGGYAAAFGDRIHDHGLKAATFSAATNARIREETNQKNPANPIDAGGRGRPRAGYLDVLRTLEIMDADEDVGATIYAETLFSYMEDIVEVLPAFVRDAAKPHLVCWQAGPMVEPVLAALRREGVLTCTDPHTALSGLRALYDHAGLRAPTADDGHATADFPEVASGVLGEADARALLDRFGIRFVREVAIDDAGALRFPVVLKGDLPGCTHKSDAGLVALGLKDQAAVQAAAAGMAARTPGITGFRVQEMVADGIELMIGVKVDADVGAAVMLGFGGIYAEAMGAPVVEMAPLSATDADRMIHELDRKGILSGYRGRVLARDRLIDLLVAVGRLAAAGRGVLREVDLNPVIVTADDAVAVDVVVITL